MVPAMIWSESDISSLDAATPFTRWREELGWLPLRLGLIDVWVAFVAEASNADLAVQFDQVLIEDERRQYAKFRFEKDRRRYLVTRSLVRYVLSRYAPVWPVDWRFASTDYGRPFIVDPHPAVQDMTFNISHSEQVVLLGITRRCQLGIDVEDRYRNVPLDIVESCFSTAEIQQLRSLPSALQPQRFLDFWTLKESYIKARGKGLTLPLEKFGFELGAGQQLRAYFDASLNDSPRNWTFWQWRPSENCIAALCVEKALDIASQIHVRRTIPFLWEKDMVFDVQRVSSS